MAVYIENEVRASFPFDAQALVERLAAACMEAEQGPKAWQLHVLFLDGPGIRGYNKEYRGIDKETDVLSFPNLDFDRPGDFASALAQPWACEDPDTGEVVLGDIALNISRVESQAEEYGHSLEREFAFLVAHSLYHLCGYDHMEEEEAACMEQKQEALLSSLGIVRG